MAEEILELKAETLELKRATTEDGKERRMFAGVALRYGDDYVELAPNVYERIHDSLLDGADMSDVKLNFNHTNGLTMLARTKSGTLRIINDKVAGVVRFEGDIPNTTAGNDVAEMVERGDVDGCSFHITYDAGGRSIKRSGDKYYSDVYRAAILKDLCITDNPAYKTGTHVEVIKRTADEAAEEIKRAAEETPKGSWDLRLKMLQAK
jgi:phage head maturation protease